MKEADVEISAVLKYINTRTTTDDFTKELSYLVEEAKLNNIFWDKYIQREVVSLSKKLTTSQGFTLLLQFHCRYKLALFFYLFHLYSLILPQSYILNR